MEEKQLSEEELHVVDIITNLAPLSQYELSGFWITTDRSFTPDMLKEILDKLLQLGLILVEKAEYQTIISMTTEMREVAVQILTEFWQHKNVKDEVLGTIAEQNYAGVLRFLELISPYDDKPRVTFSDYYFDYETHNLCLELLSSHMVFKHTSSSRKHSYESYYIRRIPINVQAFLQTFLLNKLNPEGLNLESDWKVLIIPLFSERSVKISDIRLNFPTLTQYEIYEILARLERMGAIIKEGEEIKISKATKDIMKQYFATKCWRVFKAMLMQELRRRVSERSSNLFFLGLMKRLLISRVQKPSELFFITRRDEVKNVDEDDLKEAVKLGVVFLTENEILIPHEILTDIEAILRSSISDNTAVRIPANDIFAAITNWRKIFSECKDYIKIQDEWVNEETLQIVQSYSPIGVEIKILSGIEKARDADIEEMKRRLDTIRNSGRKIELFFIGYESGKAPFHYRYIISEDVCYSISTSIKDVGKSKEADFIRISKEEKDSLVEPAFDYWIGLPAEKLKEKGIKRISFDQWLTLQS
ncbi:MAG: hypothetical protein QW491_10270 [Thermoproteota archaeon]